MKLVELINVDSGYKDKTVLKNINLEVFSNDFIGIIGPNGGGKTTLLKVILGLIPVFSGSVKYFLSGEDGSRIGYLPQYNEVDNKFPVSVLDVTLSGLMTNKNIFHRYRRKERARALQILDRMGLKNEINTQIGRLSGGQLQRTFLSRAIISSPDLLILDEPGTYVDNRFEQELYDMLAEMNERMAILLVSHDVGTISSYIKTIACVNGTLFYHDSNVITSEQLKIYNCPIDIIAHGKIPHRVLHDHNHKSTP